MRVIFCLLDFQPDFSSIQKVVVQVKFAFKTTQLKKYVYYEAPLIKNNKNTELLNDEQISTAEKNTI